MNRFAYVFIIAAAMLWGIIGIFVNKLYSFGLLPLQIVFIRASCASLILIIYLLLTDKESLKIKLADVKLFIGTGIVSFAFFNWCLFVAIKNTSLSIATILMYTAPAFVMLLSALLFKEKLTKIKIVSLVLTFAGCVLVTGILQGSEQRASTLGILAGLGAGIGYALYSIFGKYALEKYNPMTIPMYTFLAATIGMLPFTDLGDIAVALSNIEAAFYSLALALFSTVLPFIFYTKGLSKIESSKASLIATLEPVVASLVGFSIFGEAVTFTKVAGISLVIAALVIIREKEPARAENT